MDEQPETSENTPEVVDAEIAPTYSGTDYTLSDVTLDYMKRTLTANTRAAYDSQWEAFATWCAEQGRVALPATPHTVLTYAGHLGSIDRSPSSLEQAWAAIVHKHRTSGHGRPSPDVRDAYFDVITTHRRDRAQRGATKRQSAPVVVTAVAAMVDTLDLTALAGLRDRVLVVLGYSGTMRRSELAALRIGDLRFTEDGLIVTIRTSKTDKQSYGEDVHLPYGSRAATCPVRTAQAWLAALEERGVTSGPLLRRVRRGDVLDPAGLSGAAVNDIVKRLAARIDVPGASRMTAHGLRAGGPTDMARKGVPTARVAEHGRWSKKSPTVMEYVRSADAWRDNPLNGIGL